MRSFSTPKSTAVTTEVNSCPTQKLSERSYREPTALHCRAIQEGLVNQVTILLCCLLCFQVQIFSLKNYYNNLKLPILIIMCLKPWGQASQKLLFFYCKTLGTKLQTTIFPLKKSLNLPLKAHYIYSKSRTVIVK